MRSICGSCAISSSPREWAAGGPSVDLAEPDLQRQWIFNTPDEAVGTGFPGYCKGHSVLPRFLDLTLQHSFVNGDPDPNDASDPNHEGFPNNPGHVTGTISILAGRRCSTASLSRDGAPFARVIPVRGADSVASFANSAIARGDGYAIDNRVDVCP